MFIYLLHDIVMYFDVCGNVLYCFLIVLSAGAVLYCIVLFCIVLEYIVLFCVCVLFCIVLYCNVL